MPAINPQIILVALVVTSTLSILTSLNQVNAQTNENSAKIVAAGGGNSTFSSNYFCTLQHRDQGWRKRYLE